MNCPHCKQASFITTEYESVEIDQCKVCHGIWLDENEISEIVNNRIVDFAQKDIKTTIKLSFSGLPKTEQQEARSCPKCDAHLNPINYSTDSGVIIDVCPNDHGVWLDHFELEHIQQYREYWQDNVYKNGEQLIELLENEESKATKIIPQEKFHSLLFSLSMEVASLLFKKK